MQQSAMCHGGGDTTQAGPAGEIAAMEDEGACGVSVANLECLTSEEKQLYTKALAVVTLERMSDSHRFGRETRLQIIGEFTLACEPFAETYEAEAVICQLLVTIDELRRRHVA